MAASEPEAEVYPKPKRPLCTSALHLDRQTPADHSEKLGHILGCTLAKTPEDAAQVIEIGAGKRSRTSDLRITNALLYQLSYSGNTAPE
jgi:hypothetical protein